MNNLYTNLCTKKKISYKLKESYQILYCIIYTKLYLTRKNSMSYIIPTYFIGY